MTIRRQMIKAVSRSKAVMEDSISSVIDFLTASINPDGGFKERNRQSDLYYTASGLEALLALSAAFPKNQTFNFIRGFTEKNPTDLVHLAAMIRCYANLSENNIEKKLREKFIKHLEMFRTEDGGFTNTAKVKTASTNATAAAMIALNHLNQPPDKKTADWLFAQCTSDAGFLAIPMAPVPDLLSTATALHALTVTGFEIDTIKERCLDFIDSLWCGKGGFYGHWTDSIVDCEYTYCGLLALGNLGK